MKIRIWAFTSVMVLLWCGSTSTAQKATDRDAQVFGDWVVRCQVDTDKGGRRCGLSQSIRVREIEKKHRMMSTLVGYFGKSRRLGVFFTLPLGIFLPAGVTFKVGGRDDIKRLPYQYCNRDGCFASFPLDDRWLALLKGGLNGP